jgi:hypothetical protein
MPKVIMKEHYQDMRVHYVPEQIVDVDADMAAWLIKNHKALQVEDPRPASSEAPAQPPAPVEPETEQPPATPRRRSRKQ